MKEAKDTRSNPVLGTNRECTPCRQRPAHELYWLPAETLWAIHLLRPLIH